MPKATVPFGELRPDLALLDNQFANVADNVFAFSNAYKPIPSPLPISTASLPAQCMGMFAARRADGSWIVYAGTATRLYKWQGNAFVDISNNTTLAGGNYHVPVSLGERWSFDQFGQNVVAVNIGDAPQVISTESSGRFTDLAGSPPRAHGCKVIGDFLFLYGLDSDLSAVQWSGINDITQWTIGLNLCDIQHFPDMGPVVGVAGSEVAGYIVQDRGIRSLQFLPGDINFIFTFARIVKERGSISEFGYQTNADVLYLLAEDGFYALAGTQLMPIGHEKINDWFLANSDINRRNIVLCFTSNKPYVIWPFHSGPGASIYDRAAIYNWANQRWTTASIQAQMWAQTAMANSLDLDTDDPTDVNDPNLDSTSPSLDSFKYIGGRPNIALVNSQGQICSLSGPNLPATLQTAEVHLVPGMRAFVSDVYPVADTAAGVISAELRERLGDTPMTTSDVPIEITGSASVLTSSRLHRFTLKLPGADTWTEAEGLLVEAQPDGQA